eukprot:scaffold96839_cov54-Phaeocystis_antarctica.AAC.1
MDTSPGDRTAHLPEERPGGRANTALRPTPLADCEVAGQRLAPVLLGYARLRGEGLGVVTKVQVHRQLEGWARGPTVDVEEVVRVERCAERVLASVGDLGTYHQGARIGCPGPLVKPRRTHQGQPDRAAYAVTNAAARCVERGLVLEVDLAVGPGLGLGLGSGLGLGLGLGLGPGLGLPYPNPNPTQGRSGCRTAARSSRPAARGTDRPR